MIRTIFIFRDRFTCFLDNIRCERGKARGDSCHYINNGGCGHTLLQSHIRVYDSFKSIVLYELSNTKICKISVYINFLSNNRIPRYIRQTYTRNHSTILHRRAVYKCGAINVNNPRLLRDFRRHHVLHYIYWYYIKDIYNIRLPNNYNKLTFRQKSAQLSHLK
jgi:hypothetical protein